MWMLSTVKVQLTTSRAIKWFRKYRETNLNIDESLRSRRPAKANYRKILVIIISGSKRTTRKIWYIFGINQSTVSTRLSKLGTDQGWWKIMLSVRHHCPNTEIFLQRTQKGIKNYVFSETRSESFITSCYLTSRLFIQSNSVCN